MRESVYKGKGDNEQTGQLQRNNENVITDRRGRRQTVKVNQNERLIIG